MARIERLPVAVYQDGKWHLSDPYSYKNRIECSVIGEMSDGTKVWEDSAGKQYTRQNFFGKYYFCKM